MSSSLYIHEQYNAWPIDSATVNCRRDGNWVKNIWGQTAPGIGKSRLLYNVNKVYIYIIHTEPIQKQAQHQPNFEHSETQRTRKGTKDREEEREQAIKLAIVQFSSVEWAESAKTFVF